MAIASKEFIIKAMSENIINAKKKLSQNFLINEEVVLKTVDELSQNNVVESRDNRSYTVAQLKSERDVRKYQ